MRDRVRELHAEVYDAARPQAVTRIHARGKLTARERISALIDDDSFQESGALAVPPGSTPSRAAADGIVVGIGTIDGQPVAIASYDYSVFGGTQGAMGDRKLDRVLNLAIEHRWPVIVWADGGGGRAGSAPSPGGGSGRQTGVEGRPLGGQLSMMYALAELSGWAPTVAIVSGPAFAGNASVAACSDLVIATKGSAIGMAGPPLVEAALGLQVTAQEIGAVEMLEEIGGVDLLVDDEPSAIELARRYVSFFQDAPRDPVAPQWEDRSGPDDGYDMRKVIGNIVDEGQLLELRPNWAEGVITALGRVEGNTVAIIASNPSSAGGGAIDAACCDKLSRFVQLADAYGFPIVSLIDTPGFASDTGLAGSTLIRRHVRPVMALQNRAVPLYTVLVGQASGVAAQVMGHDLDPDLVVAWPASESADEDQTDVALSAARAFLVDDFIDPEDTRRVLAARLRMYRREAGSTKRRYVDTW